MNAMDYLIIYDYLLPTIERRFALALSIQRGRRILLYIFCLDGALFDLPLTIFTPRGIAELANYIHKRYGITK